MEISKVEAMSPLTWAYVGDSIYEAFIRTHLVETTNLKPHKLHVNAIKYVKAKAQAINDELRELRKEVRMCNSISRDSYKISQKQQKAQELQKQAEMEANANEHKRRSR